MRKYHCPELPYNAQVWKWRFALRCAGVGEWALGASGRVLRHKKEAAIEPPLVCYVGGLCRLLLGADATYKAGIRSFF